jgi:hypothetical protein
MITDIVYSESSVTVKTTTVANLPVSLERMSSTSA